MKQKRKQIFSLLLVAVLCIVSVFCMIPVAEMPTAHAADDDNCEHVKYDDYGFCIYCGAYEPADLISTYKAYINGSSTKHIVNVYQVSNAGQLFWFAQESDNSDNAEVNYWNDIILANDIIVNRYLTADGELQYGNVKYEWTPIRRFSGHFYGNGYTISGLYVSSSYTEKPVGFIGELGGTISNLSITDSYFSGNSKSYVGSFTGFMYDKAKIENCYTNDADRG